MDAVVSPAQAVARYLVDSGLLTPGMADQAWERQRSTQERWTTALVRSRAISGDELLRRLSRREARDVVLVDGHPLRRELLHLLPEEMAFALGVLPVHRAKDVLFVAVPERGPEDPELTLIESRLGLHLEPLPVREADVRGLLMKGLQLLATRPTPAPRSVEERAGLKEIEGPRAFDSILDRAIALGAEEIRLERAKDGPEVRFRIDGRLRPRLSMPLPPEGAAGLLAQLRSDSVRGSRFRRRTLEVEVEMGRVPLGETAVLRMRDQAAGPLALSDLGMSAPAVEGIRRALESPEGLVLVGGPAGSGRGTTLGAMTDCLKEGGRTVAVARGATPSLLGELLQKEPDVLVVEDITDGETAAAAVRTSTRGILVLARVEAPDATGAVGRLLDLRVDPTILSLGLVASVSQRLLRRICEGCRRPGLPDAQELEDLGLDRVLGGLSLRRGEGCAACGGEGLRGRVAVAEVWSPTDDLRAELSRGTSGRRLRSLALARGFRPLVLDGLEKIRAGMSTLGELAEAIPYLEILQTRDFVPGR
jgi:type IV pilus assembly protein PilB